MSTEETDRYHPRSDSLFTTRGTWGRWTIPALGAALLGGCAFEEPDRTGREETATTEAELATAAQADAATARTVQVVAPVLKCVEALSSRQLRAHFGYTNSSASAVSTPIGPFNKFVPAPAERGQPTTFARGSVADAVQVPFASSASLTWVLGTHLAVANRLSPRCPGGGAGGSGAGGVGGATGTGGITGAGGVTGMGGVTGAGGSPACPPSCDDLNPCTTDNCGPATGFSCAHAPVAGGTTCDDGNACTTGDSCQGGQCAGDAATICPAATDPCQVAACDPASGACTTVLAPNGTACSGGNFCTVGESCTAGVCGGGTERVCPASDNPCEIPHCFPDFGGFCFFNPSFPGTPCLTAGQPGVCNGVPSICTPISCENCSAFPLQATSAACPEPCADALCQDLYDCLVASTHDGSSVPSSCLAPDGTANACWCGTNPCTCATDTAPPTAANGPCLAQIVAAAGSSDPAVIQQHLGDTTSPLGHAFTLAECRAQNCSFFCPIVVPSTTAPGTVCALPAELICIDADHC